MNTMHAPKFSPPQTGFANELRSRINQYFQNNNISKFGGRKIFIKAVLILMFFVLNYSLWVFLHSEFWIKIILSVSLGIITALIGFNIMHDAAHQSFSKNKWMNDIFSYSLNLLGANVFFWKTKHNIVHHTYTNIPDVDDDIDAGIFMYLNPSKKKYYLHKFQHIYFPLVYAFLYLYWVFYADYKKYFTKKVAVVEIAKFDNRQKIIFWTSKLIHSLVFIVLPLYYLGFQQWLILFLIYAFTAGLILSVVFQLAHIVEETDFPQPDEKNYLSEEWMKHQLKTTANFAMKSKTLSYLLGGLNYQIEHHLFPNISHVHYPSLSKIVQEVCEKFNVPYYAHPTMLVAVTSHYRRLKQLGRN